MLKLKHPLWPGVCPSHSKQQVPLFSFVFSPLGGAGQKTQPSLPQAPQSPHIPGLAVSHKVLSWGRGGPWPSVCLPE